MSSAFPQSVSAGLFFPARGRRGYGALLRVPSQINRLWVRHAGQQPAQTLAGSLFMTPHIVVHVSTHLHPGGGQVEAPGEGAVPATSYVGLLVRLRLRRRPPVQRGESSTADLCPSTGGRTFSHFTYFGVGSSTGRGRRGLGV